MPLVECLSVPVQCSTTKGCSTKQNWKSYMIPNKNQLGGKGVTWYFISVLTTYNKILEKTLKKLGNFVLLLEKHHSVFYCAGAKSGPMSHTQKK